MRRRVLRAIITLAALAAGAWAADPAAALLGEILARGTTYANLAQLNDQIGGRPAASDAYARAVAFALEKFRAYGYPDAQVETFPLEAGWQRGAARAEMLAPERRTLRVASMPWSRSTPPEGVEGEIADLARGEESDFRRLGGPAALRGRIGLLRFRGLDEGGLEQLLAENNAHPVVYRRAVAAGMAALLYASPHPGSQFFALPVVGNARLTAIPAAGILRDDAHTLSRLAAGGKPVRVRLHLENRTSSSATSQNVVAELKGRQTPEQIVIVGAHYDSWDFGNGALDNGVNSMSLLEVARAFRALGLQPRATVRFILFGAEELGMIGSREYVRAHRAELDRIRAVLIMDEGAGRARGFSMGGRRDLEPRLRELLAPLEPLGVLQFTPDAFFGTDNFYFLTEGVPNLVVTQELSDFVRHYHSNTDNLERVDRREALLNSAIFAIAAHALADAPGPIGPRLARKQVLEILKENRVDEALQAWELWPLP